MFAPALIVASAALISLQTDNVTIPPRFIILPREDDLVFDIEYPTGAIWRGSADTFRGFGHLAVNGVPYRADPYAYDAPLWITDNGRTIVMPPVEMEFPYGRRLEVSRKIYVPWEAYKNYVRYYDLIHNPCNEPQLAVVQFWGDVGGRDVAEVVEMRNGFSVITNPMDVEAPQIGWLFKRGIEAHWGFAYQVGQASVVYFILIEPHSSVALVNFIKQVPYPAQVWSGAEPPYVEGTDGVGLNEEGDDLGDEMDELGADPDYDYLTEDEILQIWNMYIDADVNMDGFVNVLDMICVRNDLNKNPESATYPRSDVNRDDRINILDLIIVRNNLGWPF